MSTETESSKPSFDPAAKPATSNYQKYQTGNPLMLAVIRRFVRRICAKVEALAPKRVVDLCCGEGLIAMELDRLPVQFEYLGLDLNPQAIAEARRINPSLRFEADDIVARTPDHDWADLAICLEALEHFDEPRDPLRRILSWTHQSAIVSVPWEPYFRIGNLLRGKHLSRFGNHPEHVQQFNPRSLEALLREFSDDVRVETCFPWLIGTMGR